MNALHEQALRHAQDMVKLTHDPRFDPHSDRCMAALDSLKNAALMCRRDAQVLDQQRQQARAAA